MAPEKTGRKQAGKFQKGESGNPKGRPQGVRNKTTMAALALLEGEAEALTRKAIETALCGDLQALRLCLERILPPLKSQFAPVFLELPKTQTLADTAEAIIHAAANGDLAPDVAAQLVSAVGTLSRVIEVDELKDRLAALEMAVGRK